LTKKETFLGICSYNKEKIKIEHTIVEARGKGNQIIQKYDRWKCSCGYCLNMECKGKNPEAENVFWITE